MSEMWGETDCERIRKMTNIMTAIYNLRYVMTATFSCMSISFIWVVSYRNYTNTNHEHQTKAFVDQG